MNKMRGFVANIFVELDLHFDHDVLLDRILLDNKKKCYFILR